MIHIINVTPVTVRADSTNIRMIMLIYTAKRLIYSSEFVKFSDGSHVTHGCLAVTVLTLFHSSVESVVKRALAEMSHMT